MAPDRLTGDLTDRVRDPVSNRHALTNRHTFSDRHTVAVPLGNGDSVPVPDTVGNRHPHCYAGTVGHCLRDTGSFGNAHPHTDPDNFAHHHSGTYPDAHAVCDTYPDAFADTNGVRYGCGARLAGAGRAVPPMA
jgi:hypothetical protein